ncbi:nuclear transport factor 2 family protein [Aspergillus neoniger CBS 115656]|uniref:SnoaL-like domain-containing protein n=1 Tax=Aspergillus neoniger (strain CBS 115656) TaxID=1448310 RepID=A0A318ZE02_ASPNB|nr:hypothetical protein BO87DRAFT_426139 [Aspergillus neoniger CBS 115656]PYH34372.1 hypothetical protein BO87DRAFT_426139 [Aspergillus neoniger CBS 115656]
MAPAPSVERIRELFSPWETGDSLNFIDNVLAPDCRFVVRGSHRYAGVYDREGIKAVEMEVDKMFQVPETIAIARIFRAAEGDWVSISMASKNGSLLLNGKPYNQTYLWATKWDGEHIVEVEEYADFELLANAVLENLEERRARDEL